MDAQPLDHLEGWITIIRTATEARDKAQETIDLARSRIEEALGEAETGLIAGVPVVKWTHVASNRFDGKKAKTLLTVEQIEACTTVTESRRFTLLEVEQP